MVTPGQSEHEDQGFEAQVPYLDTHAELLMQEGLGPSSRMWSESLIDTEAHNVNLPQLHAEEGVKFAERARKIAPPELIAQYLTSGAADLTWACPLMPHNAYQALHRILEATDFGPPSSSGPILFKPTPRMAYDYLSFCLRDPNILLACMYLSLGFQLYIGDLSDRIPDDGLRLEVKTDGRQFDAANLVVALPLAVCNSLLKMHGAEATARQVDKAVIIDMLNEIRKNDQFAMRVKGMPQTEMAGIEAEFRCPMQSYVIELLAKHEVLQIILNAMHAAEEACSSLQVLAARDESEVPYGRLCHEFNRRIVVQSASGIFRSLLS